MNLLSTYHEKIENLLKDLNKKNIILIPNNLKSLSIELPPKNQKGDIACNAAMLLSKINKNNPTAIAQLLKKHFVDNFEEVDSIEVANPGFINITFKIEFWRDYLSQILKLKNSYGINKNIKKKYLVEFVSANPTGPLHVGHCRGAILGDVLSNLLIFNGHQVTKEYYVNDYGSQIKNFVKSVYFRILEILNKKKFPNDKDLYPGDYIINIAENIIKSNCIKNFDNFDKIFHKLESESIKFAMEIIKNDLSLLDIKHDNFIYESHLVKKEIVFKTVNKLKKLNYIYEGRLSAPKGEDTTKWKSRNQILFKSTSFGDDVDRALQKEDQTWTYFAGDIGYHEHKILRKFDELVNILGADHAGYIKRITSAVKALSNNKISLHCKVSQLVKLFKNNKPFKMSKRKGDYITVADLIKEVGKDSVRFMMLSRSNDVELDFDFQKVTEKSKDNPVFYVQYAYARISSIFRNLNLKMDKNIEMKDKDFLLNNHEIEILKKIAEWPRCVEISTFKLEPHIIPTYLYELCNLFHSYWNLGNQNKEFRFINEDNNNINKSRILLLQSLATVISNGMKILGVSTPNSM